LALDLLDERPLAAAEPLPHLVQRSPPLHRMVLDLRLGACEHLPDARLDLLPNAGGGGTGLADQRLHLLGVGLDPRADRLDELAPPLLERRDLLAERALRTVEVAGPAREALLEAPLLLREPREQLGAGPRFAIGDRAASLLGDAALLVREQR